MLEALADTCRGIDITPVEVKGALSPEDIEEWPNGAISNDTLNAFARSLVQLKRIGGSQSDDWNNLIANQAMQTLWEDPRGATVEDKDLRAIVGALDDTSPGDELEGMMVAQMIAAHNAAMRCYRRAMLEDQPLPRRRAPRSGEQAVSNLGGASGRARQASWQGSAKNHGRACPRSRRQPSGSWEHQKIKEGGGKHKTEEQPHAKENIHVIAHTLPR